MTPEKRCTGCAETKPVDAFYRARGKPSARCKECTKAAVRDYRARNIEQVREYDRKRSFSTKRVLARKHYRERRAASPEGRREANAKGKAWQLKNPAKRAAHILVGNAVRDGKLLKQPCECCGATEKVHAHHDDYGKPLDVIWLCPDHHGHRHRILNAFCGGTRAPAS